jgi:hypothetical protein
MTAHFKNNLLRSSDLIFVLAGRENRKEFGLELFSQGLAPKVLFSVARYEIRRFSQLSLPVPVDLLKVALDVPPPERHFFVLIEGQKVQVEHVRPGRFGTLTEIEALTHWLEDHPPIDSLLIISSEIHLCRIRICCQSFLSPRYRIALIAAPDISSAKRKFESLTAVLVERMKLLLYWAILGVRRLGWLRANHLHRGKGTPG